MCVCLKVEPVKKERLTMLEKGVGIKMRTLRTRLQGDWKILFSTSIFTLIFLLCVCNPPVQRLEHLHLSEGLPKYAGTQLI